MYVQKEQIREWYFDHVVSWVAEHVVCGIYVHVIIIDNYQYLPKMAKKGPLDNKLSDDIFEEELVNKALSDLPNVA